MVETKTNCMSVGTRATCYFPNVVSLSEQLSLHCHCNPRCLLLIFSTYAPLISFVFVCSPNVFTARISSTALPYPVVDSRWSEGLHPQTRLCQTIVFFNISVLGSQAHDYCNRNEIRCIYNISEHIYLPGFSG